MGGSHDIAVENGPAFLAGKVFKGRFLHGRIELDEPVNIADGTEISFTVVPTSDSVEALRRQVLAKLHDRHLTDDQMLEDIKVIEARFGKR